MKEHKEITGEVQNLRDKAIAINNDWYNSFSEIKDLNKGDTIKLVYTENKKNNVLFRNIVSIEKKDIKLDISDSTVNTLLMCLKDISIELIKNNKPLQLSELTNELVNSYKIIKGKI